MFLKKISDNSKEEASSLDTIEVNNANEILLAVDLVNNAETKPLVIYNFEGEIYKYWNGEKFVSFDFNSSDFGKVTALTILDNGTNFITNSTGTLLSNNATSISDITKGGVQLGKGDYNVAGSFFDISNEVDDSLVLIKPIMKGNSNGWVGFEIRFYTDKTNIPASEVIALRQTSGYKKTRNGLANSDTIVFNYNYNALPIEAIQIFGVSQQNETMSLLAFNFNILRIRK